MTMKKIHDTRFLRQFFRLFCERGVTGYANSRALAGRTLEIYDLEAGLEIRIVDSTRGAYRVVVV